MGNNLSQGYLWRAVSGIYDRADTSCICAIAANNADELFHVMSANSEDGRATCPAVFGIERDDEIRDEAKPALPASLLGRGPICHGALRSSLLALADDAAALAAVLDYGPEKADLGMCKVSVLLVVERRRRIEEGRLYPFWHIFGGNEGQGADIPEERDRRLWPQSPGAPIRPVRFSCHGDLLRLPAGWVKRRPIPHIFWIGARVTMP